MIEASAAEFGFSPSELEEYINETFNYDRELSGSEENGTLMSMGDVLHIMDNIINFEGLPTDRQKCIMFSTALRMIGYSAVFLEDPETSGISDVLIKRL